MLETTCPRCGQPGPTEKMVAIHEIALDWQGPPTWMHQRCYDQHVAEAAAKFEHALRKTDLSDVMDPSKQTIGAPCGDTIGFRITGRIGDG